MFGNKRKNLEKQNRWISASELFHFRGSNCSILIHPTGLTP